VILHFVLNDVEENTTGPEPKIDFFRNYLSIYQRPDRLSEISVFWGWARQRYLKTYRARSYIAASLEGFRQDHAKWAKCRQALDEIHRITRERGIGLLVVIFPFFHELDGDYAFQPIHDIVRGHLESEEIPVVDLRDAYRGFSGPELWVHPTDQHPNEIGHRIAADAIVGWLVEHPSVLGR